jgi:hypothetical protein
MRRALAQISIALLTVAATSSSASAAGWTQPKGQLYLKVWDRTLIGKKAFLTDGSIADLPESFQDHQLNAYFELGLHDELTLVARATPVGVSSYADTLRLYSGGFALGLRHALLTGVVPVAVEARVGGRPHGPVLGGGELPSGAFSLSPVVGTAHFDFELQAGAGCPLGLWVSGSIGSTLYTSEALSPSLTAFLQLGWTSSFGLVLDVHGNFAHSLRMDEITQVLGAGNTRYLGFGLALAYWLTPHFALSAGLEGVAYAESNAATPSLLFGFEVR